MYILKSIGDGIGTAAGVAWPTFGILSSIVGLALGGLGAIWLGAFTMGLFLLVGLPVAYWSYQNYRKEKNSLAIKLNEQKNKTTTLFRNYFSCILKQYLFKQNIRKISYANIQSIIDYLDKKIKKDFNHASQSTKQALSLAKSQWVKKLKIFQQECLANGSFDSTVLYTAIEMLTVESNSYPLKPYAFSEKCKLAMVGFTSAFGSIAGCAAGVMGLLVGVGVFTGVASVPVVGWIALGLAVGFGVMVAAAWINAACQSHEISQRIDHHTQINHAIEACIAKGNIHRQYLKKYCFKRCKNEPWILKDRFNITRSYSMRCLYPKHSFWYAKIPLTTKITSKRTIHLSF